MGARFRSSLGRRIYLWLTTSTRDKRNRVDDVGGHLQAARRARDKVQNVNDTFHAAGRGTRRAATLEGITLQGKDEGVAWSFLVLPSLFVIGLISFISQYGRKERRAQQLAAERLWQRRLQDAVDKSATANAALRIAHEQNEEMKTAMRGFAEECALGAKLESNLEFIKKHLHPQGTTE